VVILPDETLLYPFRLLLWLTFMWKPQQGNKVLLLLFAAAISALSLPLAWGIYQIRSTDLKYHLKVNGMRVDPADSKIESSAPVDVRGMKIEVRGDNGHALLGATAVPYWLAPGAIIAGLLLTLLNYVRFSAVPRKIILSLSAAGGLLVLLFVLDIFTRGGIAAVEFGWIPCWLGAWLSNWLSRDEVGQCSA
jgi:hypothetical protein